jgi:hypothetical protein
MHADEPELAEHCDLKPTHFTEMGHNIIQHMKEKAGSERNNAHNESNIISGITDRFLPTRSMFRFRDTASNISVSLIRKSGSLDSRSELIETLRQQITIDFVIEQLSISMNKARDDSIGDEDIYQDLDEYVFAPSKRGSM